MSSNPSWAELGVLGTFVLSRTVLESIHEFLTKLSGEMYNYYGTIYSGETQLSQS